ncbi:sigma-70 family RNA polymerase sigma factor [Fodinibacter luteus]|uniref:sigma-70 family RNA polymerase sigma factor n=1 Tax=Fodinibacter luteus TaxID=552064 RepID=UPI0031EDCE7C
MTASGPHRSSDADFEEFAQARERTLVRSAFLVCGDAHRAEDLVHAALVTLARHWDSVRHELPDAFVRRSLYREALRSARDRGTGTGTGPTGTEPVDPDRAPWDAEEVRQRLESALSAPVWEEPDDDAWRADEARLRRDVQRALRTLTARQRAVLVLLALDARSEPEAAEVLGCSVATVEAQAGEAMALLRAALTDPWPQAAPDPMTSEIGPLLELASDDLPDPDLAGDALAEARTRHRTVVRRTVLGVGVVAAAGVVASVVARDPTDRRPVPVESTPPALVDGRLPSVEVDGVAVFLAPDPRSEVRLPRFPGADGLGLPGHLRAGHPATAPVLGEGGLRGIRGPVRAVLFAPTADGAVSPVLLCPGVRGQYVLAPMAVLPNLGEETDLHPRTIAAGRHRVVFLRPFGIVVLDARDGSVVEVAVPDLALRSVGWAVDDVTVVAHGRYESWVVDTVRGTVRGAEGPVHAGWADLALGDPGAVLRTHSRTGALTGSRELVGPPVVPNGLSVSDAAGWVAVFAYLTAGYQRAAGRSQGLVAVPPGTQPVPSVLAAQRTDLVPDRCFRALAWQPGGVLLFESRSQRTGFEFPIRRVLAWDVAGGRLWRVAEVDRDSGEGAFSGSFIL